MTLTRLLRMTTILSVLGMLLIGCSRLVMGYPDHLTDVPVYNEGSNPPIYEDVYGRPIPSDVYKP